MVDGIAIVAGSLITSFVDVTILKIISGIIFILFDVYMLINKKEEKEEKNMTKIFLFQHSSLFF